MSNESEPHSIECPACSEQINETIGWFKQDSCNCPHCDANIRPNELGVAVEKLFDQFDSIADDINKKLRGE